MAEIADVPEQSSPRNTYKLLFFALLLLIFMAGVGAAAYYFGMDQGSKVYGQQISPTPVTEFPTPSISPESDFLEEVDLVAPGPNTISFARAGNYLLLKYRGKIYDERQTTMEPVSIDQSQYKWYGLVDAPEWVPAGKFMFDEIFDIKSIPQTNEFVFIMRWTKDYRAGEEPNKEGFHLIHYHQHETYETHEVKVFTRESEGGKHYVPKIMSFSNDATYVALRMHQCWNCGGQVTATGLLNLDSAEYKTIGGTIELEWLEDGNYSYKELKEITCGPDIQMGSCFEKSENLPNLGGSFY